MSVATQSTSQRDRKRYLKDKVIRAFVTLGGISILAALLLIFIYLFSVISPIFQSSDSKVTTVPNAKLGMESVLVHIDDHGEHGYLYDESGKLHFFSINANNSLKVDTYTIAKKPVLFAHSAGQEKWVAYIQSDGVVNITQAEFITSYGEEGRIVTPNLISSKNHEIELSSSFVNSIVSFNFYYDESQLVFVFLLDNGSVEHHQIMPTGNVVKKVTDSRLERASRLLLSAEQQSIYVQTSSQVLVLNQHDASFDIDHDINAEQNITDISLMSGEMSLLVATQDFSVTQWVESIDSNVKQYKPIRKFSASSVADKLISFPSSKAFISIANDGGLEAFWATSEKKFLDEKRIHRDIKAHALSANEKYLLLLSENGIEMLELRDSHAEISWRSVFNRVWYEGYSEPGFVWQTTAANDDFEAKYSLTPLIFGTLKAAAFAMLFAVPLAILGAIYSAYFMAPRLRNIVKPSIELTEALPTVIIGFIAGVWLAPEIDKHLIGFMLSIIVTVLSVFLLSYVWQKVPSHFSKFLPNGWHIFLVAPIIAVSIAISIVVAPWIELNWFSGDIQVYLNQHGIGYDQRNALIVGIAMGFAVIPTIFTIAEDAIYSVPKHLSDGSLALGATEWQTLIRVVLLTASPGIFSAIMLGLGRAVGETMIVLMATGNTPLMDWNIFEGMRSLAATIAIETPESEVNSTHFRMLFLAALILFIFTFVINSIAGYVRQRLQAKYRLL